MPWLSHGLRNGGGGTDPGHVVSASEQYRGPPLRDAIPPGRGGSLRPQRSSCEDAVGRALPVAYPGFSSTRPGSRRVPVWRDFGAFRPARRALGLEAESRGPRATPTVALAPSAATLSDSRALSLVGGVGGHDRVGLVAVTETFHARMLLGWELDAVAAPGPTSRERAAAGRNAPRARSVGPTPPSHPVLDALDRVPGLGADLVVSGRELAEAGQPRRARRLHRRGEGGGVPQSSWIVAGQEPVDDVRANEAVLASVSNGDLDRVSCVSNHSNTRR